MCIRIDISDDYGNKVTMKPEEARLISEAVKRLEENKVN